jgi:hypothetical protein
MPYVRDSFWRGREWTSLAQMQDAAVTWCREVAGRRCVGRWRRVAVVVFEAVEASELNPLPRKRSVLAAWSTGTVGLDIHVKVGKALYSVPWRHIGRQVDVRSTATMVQVFDGGKLIATHGRRPTGKATDMSHYPPEKIAFTMRGPTWCRTRAAEIGGATVAVIAELLRENALFRLRAAQGVLGLADKHGPARLELACAKAIAVGDPTYCTIKGVLAAGLEADPAPPPTGDGGAAAFLHVLRGCFGTSWPCPARTPAPAPQPSRTPPWTPPPRASTRSPTMWPTTMSTACLTTPVLRPPDPSRPPPTRHRQTPRRPELRASLPSLLMAADQVLARRHAGVDRTIRRNRSPPCSRSSAWDTQRLVDV